jgi:hypothetical protein|tara:strand:- start:474 stop:782 length:309 start_codon:yes stop_codon:yes gene_type:complete
MSDNKLKAGAVYRLKKDDGSVEEFLCWSTIKRPNHPVSGWIQRFGHAKQVVKEGSEVCKALELVEEKKEQPAPVKKAPVKRTTRKTSSKKASVKASEKKSED